MDLTRLLCWHTLKICILGWTAIKVMLEWGHRLHRFTLFFQLNSSSFWQKRIFKFLWEFSPRPHVPGYFYTALLCILGLLSTCKLILWSLKLELSENSFQGEDFWKTVLHCLLVMWTWPKSCIIVSLKKATWVVWREISHNGNKSTTLFMSRPCLSAGQWDLDSLVLFREVNMSVLHQPLFSPPPHHRPSCISLFPFSSDLHVYKMEWSLCRGREISCPTMFFSVNI